MMGRISYSRPFLVQYKILNPASCAINTPKILIIVAGYVNLATNATKCAVVSKLLCTHQSCNYVARSDSTVCSRR